MSRELINTKFQKNGAVSQSPLAEGRQEPENTPVVNENIQSEVEKIVALVESGIFQIVDIYPDWRLIGYAIADALHEKGREIYHRLCRHYEKYCPQTCDEHYNSCLNSNTQMLPFSNLSYYGWKAGKEEINAVQRTSKLNNLDEGDKSDQTNNTFPDSIYPTLPEILHKTIRFAETPEEMDLFLLGSIVAISACLPKIFGIYDGRKVYSNLYLFVTGSAAVGKGRLIFCKGLIQPIHQELREESRDLKEQYKQDLAYANSSAGKKDGIPKPADPPEKMLIIPANNSSSGVFQILSDSDGLGIIFETEGDTLQQAFKTDYGNYSDGFRKAFHHESISFYRRTNRESVEIPNPRLSTILSGTPKQVEALIPDSENGLFSRFIFYNINSKPSWRDVFRTNEGKGLDSYFEKLGTEFYTIFDDLRTIHPIEIKLTEGQQEKFNLLFSNSSRKYFDVHGPDYVATIRRLGLIAFRLCMVLSALRIKKPSMSQSVIYCLEPDFQTVMKMIKVLVKHSESIFIRLPEVKQSLPMKNLKERYYDTLPDSFDRNKYQTIAKSLSIPGRSADGYIAGYMKSGILHRESHNLYSKK